MARMRERRQHEQLQPHAPLLTPALESELLRALHFNERVEGHTHAFYRYPARFSPEFARTVIAGLSEPGDSVLDPFAGGGTSVVEAVALGRRVVGIDINPLACFVARVKSTPLTRRELDVARRLVLKIGDSCFSLHDNRAGSDPLFNNVPSRIRMCVQELLGRIVKTENLFVRNFLRCALLKTSQWALDCRETIPRTRDFKEAFRRNGLMMCDQVQEYGDRLRLTGLANRQSVRTNRRLLLRSAQDLQQDSRIPEKWRPFKLVVTSPPYPGVHVLYHRWQVRSRRETAAPFAIVGSPDGHVPSFFTFGDRRRTGTYFDCLTRIYRSVAKVLDRDSIVVQLVSFANREDASLFLDAMNAAGYDECRFSYRNKGSSRSLWRVVPHRKWYVDQRDDLSSGKELLLLHRLKRA